MSARRRPQALNAVKARGGRIVCVGTTSLRLLESAARRRRRHRSPGPAPTGIFITPGYRFRAVDMLMTNFHLPRSTLFMLVSAFSGLGDDARCLCPCHRHRLPLLFLWRFQPALSGTDR